MTHHTTGENPAVTAETCASLIRALARSEKGEGK